MSWVKGWGSWAGVGDQGEGAHAGEHLAARGSLPAGRVGDGNCCQLGGWLGELCESGGQRQDTNAGEHLARMNSSLGEQGGRKVTGGRCES